MAVDDIILENDEERFSISIALNNPEVLAEIDSSRSQVDVTITDNEGDHQVYITSIFALKNNYIIIITLISVYIMNQMC